MSYIGSNVFKVDPLYIAFIANIIVNTFVILKSIQL